MNRYEFLTYLWSLTDKYSHHISSEFLALDMADRYVMLNGNNYNKELAYVVTVVSAKLNEEGGGMNNIKELYKMECDVCISLDWKFNNTLMNQLGKIFEILNINKKLGPDFVLLLRYLQWCNIKTDNVFVILLAVQLLKIKELPIFKLMKFIRLYNILQELEELYDVNIK